MSVNQDNEIALSEIEFTFVGVPMWINFKGSQAVYIIMCGSTFQTTSLGHLSP